MAHNVHKRATLGNPTITGLVIRWDKDTIPSRIDPQFLPDAVNTTSHERPATNVAGAPWRAPDIRKCICACEMGPKRNHNRCMPNGWSSVWFPYVPTHMRRFPSLNALLIEKRTQLSCNKCKLVFNCIFDFLMTNSSK
jgi:hypothetical protein